MPFAPVDVGSDVATIGAGTEMMTPGAAGSPDSWSPVPRPCAFWVASDLIVIGLPSAGELAALKYCRARYLS